MRQPIPHEKSTPGKISCGRWGEADKEKGPADLFPTGPTIEPRQGEETLRPWAQGSPRLINEKEPRNLPQLFSFIDAEDGT